MVYTKYARVMGLVGIAVLATALLAGCRQGQGTQAVQAALPQAPATQPTAATAPQELPVPHRRAAGTIAPAPEVIVPILMFHHVRDLPAKASSLESDLTVSPAHFEEQLSYLEKLGCNTVTLEQIHAFFSEKRPLPAKPVCITFDDGYLDNYTVVYPALKRHGMVGVFFIITGVVGNGTHVTWDDLREMHGAGMDIESHTVHHLELPSLTLPRLRDELYDSRKRLNQEIGGVTFLSYPSGRKSDQVVAEAKRAGYQGAVTTEHGATMRADRMFLMPRVRVHGTWGAKALEESIASSAGNEYRLHLAKH